MKNLKCKLCNKEFDIINHLALNRVYCYECMPDGISRSKQLIQLRTAMKKQLVIEHGGKCVNCGYDNYFGSLEFHHINNNSKEFGIGTGCRDYEKLFEESKKCVLLCSNCHRELHAGLIDIKEPSLKI